MSKRKQHEIREMISQAEQISAKCQSIIDEIGSESPALVGCLFEAQRMGYRLRTALGRYLECPEGKGGRP